MAVHFLNSEVTFMKRLLSLTLIAALLFSGCTPSSTPTQVAPEPSSLSVTQLLDQLLSAVPEGHEQPEIVPAEELSAYLMLYGTKSDSIQDCAIARLGGSAAFELAVLDLQAPSAAVGNALLDYLLLRQSQFAAYAPDQADIIENSVVFSAENGCRLILAVTENPNDVKKVLTESGYTNVTEVSYITVPSTEHPPVITPEPSPEPTFELPPGWMEYTDPQTDDMSIYDTSSILAAWKAKDPSGLNEKDQDIYYRCVGVIGQYITEGMSDYAKEAAIYFWLTKNVSYDNRHHDDPKDVPRISYEPYGALMEGTAVCLGYAATFQLFMDMLDVECITVLGSAFESTCDHAWNMVRLDGEWYCVDPTWDIGGNRRYFNATSDFFARTDHQWDYASVPIATATYYRN